MIIIINKAYIRDKDKLRLIIDDYMEKIRTVEMTHRIEHEGIQKTYDRIKQNHYWKSMILDIRKYISICKIYQLNRSVPIQNLVKLRMDIIGPLKITSKRNRIIIAYVDHFSYELKLNCTN